MFSFQIRLWNPSYKSGGVLVIVGDYNRFIMDFTGVCGCHRHEVDTVVKIPYGAGKL